MSATLHSSRDLLFGTGRTGTRTIRRTPTEQTVFDEQLARIAYRLAGGRIVERADGTIEWRNTTGQLHRTDGPAAILADGVLQWWQTGSRHRTDGPAELHPNGDYSWWCNGQLHRESGPAVKRWDKEEWWLNGDLHRESGPAQIDTRGTKRWFVHGHLHRTDGPAILERDGTCQWWLNNRRYQTADLAALAARRIEQ